MTRLNFELPEFFRPMWSSDRSRNEWDCRVRAIAAAISELQWLTVARDVRACGIARISPEQLERMRSQFARRGVEAIEVGREALGSSGYQSIPGPYVPGQPFQHCIAFGKRGTGRDLAVAVERNDSQVVGSLLGYPECCIRSFLNNWSDSEQRDPIWPMARASIDGSPERQDGERTIRIDRPSLANILLRQMGLRAVYHLPCRFNCPGSHEVAKRVLAVGTDEGFGPEMSWLSEVLHWPMEWTALHGIAEIKTPVMKCSSSTDATAELYCVLIDGSEFPREGAKGIGHVYQILGQGIATQ